MNPVKKKPTRDAEYRRGQNRLAQQRYRQRQKQRLALVDIKATTDQRSKDQGCASWSGEGNTLSSGRHNSRVKIPYGAFKHDIAADSFSPATVPLPTSTFDISDIVLNDQALTSTTETQFENAALPTTGAVFEYGLQPDDGLSSPLLSRNGVTTIDPVDGFASGTPMLSNPGYGASLNWNSFFSKTNDPRQMTSNSIVPLTDFSNDVPAFEAQSYPSNITSSSLPCPRINHLHLLEVNLFAACLENARHLNVSADLAIADGFQSPFSSRMHADRRDLADFFNLKPDLRPCREQIKVPHDFWIDTLPLPALRTAILRNLQRTEWIMIGRDIDDGGIVCWGSTESNYGLGVPWDLRSWEMRPWFIQKWQEKGLFVGIGGLDTMLETMSWWAHMRGDPQSCVQIK